MTKLPEWLEAELPEMREVEYIDFDWLSGTFTFQGLDYHTIVDAWRAARKSGMNFEYTNRALNTENVEDDGFLGPTYRQEHSSLWIAPYTDKRHLDFLEMMYGVWLETDELYRKNPEDWVMAYTWIRDHPAFWTRSKDEKTWDWKTNGGTDIYTMVMYHEGKPMVGFETGGHTPGYTQTYHDIDLDVYAPTFEDAYVKLAKRIDKFFAPDGTERPGVREALDTSD